MPTYAQPRHDLTKLPIQDEVWVEVYWRDDAAGKGPCASLFAHGVELMRFDCFDGDQGHCHINFQQTHGQRWYYRPGPVRQHIDQSAFDLAQNLTYALRTNNDPAIQQLKFDRGQIRYVAERMQKELLKIADQLGM